MDFYSADFRLREFIVKCLKSKITQSAKSAIKHIFPRNIALQLASSHFIGFGTIKDDRQATLVLTEHSLKYADLQNEISLINDNIQEFWNMSDLFSLLAHQGHIQGINFPQYYRERKLLERAEVNYEQEIQSLQLVFGRSHRLCLGPKTNLAKIKGDQGRWKEAAELQMQVMMASSRALGQENPYTLISMANVAFAYRDQRRWKEAEELSMEVMKRSKKVLGQEHPNTLIGMGSLASTYRSQGRWKEAAS